MMDTEKKPENDEDENTNTEAKDSSSVSSHEDCGPVFDVIANSSENSTSKRGFPESSDFSSATVGQDGNNHASKRMKLSAEAEHLQCEVQGVHGLEASESTVPEVRVPLGGTVKETLPDDRLDGGTCLPGAFSPPCSLSTTDAVSLRTDTEKTSAQEMVSLDPERDSPLPLEEISVSCTVGNVDAVLRCDVCGHLFSSCSDLEKHAECHLQPPREHVCCHCSHKAESSMALHTHVRQAHGPQQLFSCDLCGFQCAEENLLNAHYLGKTHLRRQNLAARGGFVQILTKQPFPKKPCSMGGKNVRVKPRASKPISKASDSKGLRSVGNKFKDFRASVSKQSGSSSELLVEMVASRNTPSENVEIVEESVTSRSIARNPENQGKTKKLALVSSEGLLGKLESTRNSLQAAHSISATSRPRPERNVLTLGGSFRRRSGTFSLKGQAKKRFTLLGISKRATTDAQRAYMKHLRTQVKTGDAVSASGSVRSPCATSSEMRDPKQDGRGSRLACSSDFPTARPAADLQTCPGTDCAQVATDRTELETRGEERPSGEVKVRCQERDLSGPSRRGSDRHLYDSQHQHTATVLTCQYCSFSSENELQLREHMQEKHNLCFLCAPCSLFFLSQEDLEEHRTTEKHIRLLVQPKTSLPLNNDLVSQSLPLRTLESESTKDSVSESGKAVQEDPAKSRVSHGHEVRHSSKPQFQCKKCFYKTRSSTVLTRHIKLRHGQDYHFLCKACNLYSLSKEGMEKHIKRSKHLENAKKNNIGLSFEECIERVCIGANDKKEEFQVSGNGRVEGHVEGMQLQERVCLEKSMLTTKELSQSGEMTKEGEVALTATPKRGRPKGNLSRTCSHCGLLASSITNLTVHIRRKHSHQYSYLCKVCKYYTVTKGDMERHCATKKHKGRVEVEASGKQSSDIIVGPEGGNLESCGKNVMSAVSGEHVTRSAESDASFSEKPAAEHRNPAEVDVENEYHSVDGEADSHLPDKKEQMCLEPEDPVQQGDATGASDNKCAHCEFNAHSSASLELHIKRKHTKEFAFYCMACDYYAVTRREMTRHAATEKHKVKRQSYLNSSDIEASSADVPKNIIIPKEQHQQNSEDYQVISDQPSEEIPKSRSTADGSVLDENVNLDVSKVLRAPDSVEIETEEESNLSEEHSFCETFQQPLVNEKALKPEDVVSLNIASNCGSPSRFQSENAGSSALEYETVQRTHSMLNDIGGPSTGGGSDMGHVGETADEVLSKHGCPGGLGGGHPAESTVPVVMTRTSQEQDLESSGQNDAGSVQSSEDLKDTQDDPVLENKEILMDSQHETKIILEEDGPASDSTVESNDVYETIISIDDKGQAMYSFGRFDSSIIRIKSPEDGELLDQSEERLLTTGVRISELPLKDCAQGVKKKKSEGGSFGESTRIRCDDCGFLADGLSGLNVHIAMKHPTKEKHFHCLLCGKSFYTESNLHQHLASAGHMRNEQASVEELPEGGATFKCVKCTEPFDSEQNLFLHIKGQHEELLREVNKYIVEDTEQINREREENQGNVCKYCGKMCRSSNSMAFLAHIRTHTGTYSSANLCLPRECKRMVKLGHWFPSERGVLSRLPFWSPPRLMSPHCTHSGHLPHVTVDV